jgi:hypothetical protein
MVIVLRSPTKKGTQKNANTKWDMYDKQTPGHRTEARRQSSATGGREKLKCERSVLPNQLGRMLNIKRWKG